ncbi:MAG: hypothetical protein H3C34_18655 [Caldilineaceae bacterium]|nr:hypothetical protein [Caldilineaceae bacterium]
MPTSEERKMILQMVEEGRISPEDGARLLAAIGQSEEVEESEDSQVTAGGRFLRVQVTDKMTGQKKVSVTLPIGLVTFGLRFIPASSGIDVDALRAAIADGQAGRIVDVVDEKEGNHVEIFVE